MRSIGNQLGPQLFHLLEAAGGIIGEVWASWLTSLASGLKGNVVISWEERALFSGDLSRGRTLLGMTKERIKAIPGSPTGHIDELLAQIFTVPLRLELGSDLQSPPARR